MKKKRGKLRGIGIPLEGPGYAVPFSDVEQEDSTHVLTCPKCGQRRYTDARFSAFLEEVQGLIEKGEIQADLFVPRHKPCNAIMTIARLEES